MALTSFFSALTGLNANSHTINVIGDNLANLNTVGFKAGKATFAEIIGGMSGFSSTGNPIVFGQGALLNGVVHKQSAGTPEYTGNSTDVMINGSGYFVVATGDGGIGYTRAGRFQFDSTGNLVTSDGYQLMGYLANDKGEIDHAAGIKPIEIRMGQFMPAVATTTISAAVNLDSQSPVSPAIGSEFVTPIEVFDALGAQHVIQLQFTKNSPPGAANPEWTMNAYVLDGAGNRVPIEIDDAGTTTASFNLQFATDGRLDIAGSMPASLTLMLNGAGTPPTMAGGEITISLVDERGNPMFTSAATESGTSYTTQNGYASSSLKAVAFDNNGVVIGLAANGNSIELAQLAVATFPNVEGMQKYSGSTFIASRNAGEPSIGTANSGGRGTVMGGSLEMSNVDMAEEFINLIIAQRAFQANARVITTSDELYQEAIYLKR
jgi:flagellar hook protein FlgE